MTDHQTHPVISSHMTAPDALPSHSTLVGRIFAATQRETATIDAWGVAIEIRGLLMGDRSRLLTDAYTKEREPIYAKFYPLLLRACCYDPDTGEQIFATVTDDELNALSAHEVERVAAACLNVAGLSPEAQKTTGNGSGGITTDISPTS